MCQQLSTDRIPEQVTAPALRLLLFLRLYLKFPDYRNPAQIKPFPCPCYSVLEPSLWLRHVLALHRVITEYTQGQVRLIPC
jgi:hypothetical protein